MKQAILKILKKEEFRRHCVIAALLFLYVYLLQVLKIYSPITYLFGVPTPTTGITRAWIDFLQGDFIGAMEKHPLFLLAIPYALSLYAFMLRKKKMYFVIALTLTFIYWLVFIYRIYNHTIYF